jgi:adenylate cyclase
MTAHILVVDDEPDVEALILQKFRHKIRGGAITFLFARNGIEALAVLEANGQIDLVVTDINMPRMDGPLLLQKLQENEKQVSTIIVSAYGDMITTLIFISASLRKAYCEHRHFLFIQDDA